MIMSPAKMAEVIELLFRLWTWVVPRNDVLHEDQIRHAKGAVLRGGEGWPIVKFRTLCHELCKNG